MEEHDLYLNELFSSTKHFYDNVYPLVIVADRYTGVYSRGKFTAWNCNLDEIPKAIEGEDVDCMNFWWKSQLNSKTYIVCGVGDTPDEAITSLIQNLKRVEA